MSKTATEKNAERRDLLLTSIRELQAMTAGGWKLLDSTSIELGGSVPCAIAALLRCCALLGAARNRQRAAERVINQMADNIGNHLMPRQARTDLDRWSGREVCERSPAVGRGTLTGAEAQAYTALVLEYERTVNELQDIYLVWQAAAQRWAVDGWRSVTKRGATAGVRLGCSVLRAMLHRSQHPVSGKTPTEHKLFGWCLSPERGHLSALNDAARAIDTAGPIQRKGAAPSAAAGRRYLTKHSRRAISPAEHLLDPVSRIAAGREYHHRSADSVRWARAKIDNRRTSALLIRPPSVWGNAQRVTLRMAYVALTRGMPSVGRWARNLSDGAAAPYVPTVPVGRPEAYAELEGADGVRVQVYRFLCYTRDGLGYAYAWPRCSDLYHCGDLYTTDPDAHRVIHRALLSRINPELERQQQVEQQRAEQRAERAKMLRDCRALPFLTLQHSYAAGNCRPGTMQFCAALGIPVSDEESRERVEGREVARRWRSANYPETQLFAQALRRGQHAHAAAQAVLEAQRERQETTDAVQG